MNKEPLNRPSWDNYFMAMAMLVATRSPDAQWKAGCVIVNDDKHIVATGYNGFPPGMLDNKIPNKRPDKYLYVIHSECNSLLNATQSVKGCTLYTNGQPCLECLKKCVSAGIKKFVVTKGKAQMVREYNQEQAIFDEIVRQCNVEIIEIDFDDRIIQQCKEIAQVSK